LNRRTTRRLVPLRTCRFYTERRGVQYDPAQVVVGHGAKQSVYEAIHMLCRTGDEVIVPSPYWVSYAGIVDMAGATVVDVATTAEQGWVLQPDDLAAAITPSTRMLVLCNPCNPTGAVMSRVQLEAVAAVLRQPAHQHVWILADEIYHQLLYDGASTACFASLADMKDRTITIDGCSKAYAMCGFRLGWLCAPPAVAKACARMQGQINSCANTVAMAAAEAALALPADALAPVLANLADRRQYLLRRLEAMPGVTCRAGQGALYLFPNISCTLGKQTAQGTVITGSDAFCEAALKEAGVCCVPGTAFGMDGYVRVGFAVGMDAIEKGADRLEAFITSLVVAEEGGDAAAAPIVMGS